MNKLSFNFFYFPQRALKHKARLHCYQSLKVFSYVFWHIIEMIQRIHTQQGFHQANGVCEDISKPMENSKGNSPNQWDNFNFRDDDGTTLGIHNLQLLLQKLQDAQENPKLSPMVQNLLATRDLTLRNT